jgi:hypothetical protein
MRAAEKVAAAAAGSSEDVRIGSNGFLSIMVITAYLLLDAPRLSRFVVYQFVPPRPRTARRD